MYWALYALKWCIKENIQSLNSTLDINATLSQIEVQLELMEENAATIFHGGSGLIRWNSYIGNSSISPDHAEQVYSGSAWGTDAYEVPLIA